MTKRSAEQAIEDEIEKAQRELDKALERKRAAATRREALRVEEIDIGTQVSGASTRLENLQAALKALGVQLTLTGEPTADDGA